MPLNRSKSVAITKTTTAFADMFQCKSWVANALLQVSESYMPGIKDVLKKNLSYQRFGRATGVYFWLISCIKHSDDRMPREMRELYQYIDLNEHITDIQKRLCWITKRPLHQSIKFFRAFSSAISRPIFDKEGIPTKPIPNAELYYFLIKNHEKVENLQSVKKIHEWLLRESRFKPTEANFRKMCSRLGLCFRKN